MQFSQLDFPFNIYRRNLIQIQIQNSDSLDPIHDIHISGSSKHLTHLLGYSCITHEANLWGNQSP